MCFFSFAHPEIPARDVAKLHGVHVHHFWPGVAQLRQMAAGSGAFHGGEGRPGEDLHQPVAHALLVTLLGGGEVGEVRCLAKELSRQVRSPECRFFPFSRRFVAQLFNQSPQRIGAAARRFSPGQQGHLTPAVGILASQFRYLGRIARPGEVAGGQVLLKGAVRKGVNAVATGQQQPGAVAKVFHQLTERQGFILAEV